MRSAARFERGRFADARALFEQVATSVELQDFLTLPAYEILVKPADVAAQQIVPEGARVDIGSAGL
jgi:hypothetical protein